MVPGAAVLVSLPVQPFWPQPPHGVVVTHGPTAEVVRGLTLAEVEVKNLDWPVRLCLAAGHLVLGAVNVLAGLAAYRISGLFRYPDQPVFQPAVSRIVELFARSLMVGGLAWQLLFTVSGSMAAQQALTFSGWSEQTDILGTDSTVNGPLGIAPALGINVDFWPVFVGLGLLAVVAMLRHGEKLEASVNKSPAG